MTASSDALSFLINQALRERDTYREALHLIANINNGPDRESGEYRCIEAAELAQAALVQAVQPR